MKARVALLLLLFVACKTTQPPPTRPPAMAPSALLGSAYDATTQEYTGMSCLDITALSSQDYEFVPPKWNELRSIEAPDRTFLDGIFGNFQWSFYSEATGLRLSRPREAVNRILSGPLEKTQLLVLASKPGLFRIRPGSLRKLKLTPEARALAADREAFVQLCGTDFLSGTSFTVGMGATLRLTFANEADVQAFTGDLHSLDESRFAVAATLRYDSYLKETWDVNLRTLGDPGSRECAPGNFDPCLDAFRLFQNITLPKYQKMLATRSRNPDQVLPLAYLTQAEKTSYAVLNSSLRSLGPNASEQADWSALREAFVEHYAKAAKAQDKDRMRQISNQAAPCYRPRLDREACAAQLKELSQP